MSAPVIAIDHTGKHTGPRSIAGRETSSANATLHGGTSRNLIVAGESAADFEALLHGLLGDYQPDTMQSRHFVEYVATAQWFLWRRQRACNAIESALYEAEPDEAKWTEAHLKRLALADRYKTQAERALKRALANLQALQKWARGEEDRATRHAQWEAEQSVRERRIALGEQKCEQAKSKAAAQTIRFAKNAVSSPSGVTIVASEPASEGDAVVATSLLQCQQA